MGFFNSTAFLLIHVVLSVVGIVSGVVAVYAMLTARELDKWTITFLVSMYATYITGFLFPFHQLLPSHIFGVISLVILSLAVFARYARRYAGHWRWIYSVGLVIALYLNVFVFVFQLFLKTPALKALAPTQSEPPFLVSQLLVLGAFVVIGTMAAMRFRQSEMPVASNEVAG